MEKLDCAGELNVEQKAALALWENGSNLFITGAGGTGKSRLLGAIIRAARARWPGKDAVGVTSMTGAAAFLIQGQTFHSWAGIRLGEGSIQELIKTVRSSKSGALGRWQKVEVLILDEISMMDLELFEKMEALAREIRGLHREPRLRGVFFGGIQLVFAGDFAQLPPVKKDNFCFESPLWQNHLDAVTIYLTRNMRQADPAFQKILTEMRLGRVSPETRVLLGDRVGRGGGEVAVSAAVGMGDGMKDRGVGASKSPGLAIKPTLLYPMRKDVDSINEARLKELIGSGAEKQTYLPQYRYRFTVADGDKTRLAQARREVANLLGGTSQPVTGRKDLLDYPPFSYNRSNYSLTLAVGAQVMLTYNWNVEKGLVNGTRGVVVGFDITMESGDEWCPMVAFDTGETLGVPRLLVSTTEFDGYDIFVEQIPLQLAWAYTIHKAQGATISLVTADLSGVFCPGQVYVCLSRVRSLEGLCLIGWDARKVQCHPKVVAYYEALGQKINTNNV